ncbi:MAG: hypothetical protein M1429_01290 [Patescibacteria group bacterium]|nr:hypothetical protein [Patescibacteria group bacterium]
MENSNLDKKPPFTSITLLLIVGLIGLGLGIGGTIAYNYFKAKSTTASTSTPTKTSTPASTTTVKAQIKEAMAATSIDKDGKAVNPNNSFDSKTDKSIYVVGTLKNVSKGAKIEYVRYLNGKYLDSKIATITNNNLKYYSFIWTSKTAQNEHPTGVYMVKLYLNGDVNEAITYTVK